MGLYLFYTGFYIWISAPGFLYLFDPYARLWFLIPIFLTKLLNLTATLLEPDHPWVRHLETSLYNGTWSQMFSACAHLTTIQSSGSVMLAKLHEQFALFFCWSTVLQPHLEVLDQFPSDVAMIMEMHNIKYY